MDKSKRHFPDRHYEGTVSRTPLSLLNTTVRRFPLAAEPRLATEHEIRAGDVQQQWRSRDNRKGRHALVLTPKIHRDTTVLTPRPTSSGREILEGIWRMLSRYPYWDVSYLVAMVFTLGSVVWVINAFFVWLPLVDPSTEFKNERSVGGGVTALIGATIFEVGSVLLMIEAVNENRSECFGWALEEVLEERHVVRVMPMTGCAHHHRNKGNLVGKGKVEGDTPIHHTPIIEPTSKDARTWTWWPTWHGLRTHYFREFGFLASLSQMIGATIFWIAGFTAIPPISNRLGSTAAQNGAYWLPQVVGGTGFIVSGTLFTLETQKRWYIPAPGVLGWHIGVWNLIGGIGFTLCGALGFASGNSGAAYQASLATFWGSWCFLLGSIIQWYESLDKHPVEVDDRANATNSQPVS